MFKTYLSLHLPHPAASSNFQVVLIQALHFLSAQVAQLAFFKVSSVQVTAISAGLLAAQVSLVLSVLSAVQVEPSAQAGVEPQASQASTKATSALAAVEP